MREASGLRNPIECFGCANCPRVQNDPLLWVNRFHRFTECPLRGDRDVHAAGMEKIREMRRARFAGGARRQDGNAMKRTNAMMAAGDEGGATPTATGMVNTSRQLALQSMMRNGTDTLPIAAVTPRQLAAAAVPQININGSNVTTAEDGTRVYSLMIPIFLSRQRRNPVDMTSNLPHIDFELGYERSTLGIFKLKVAVDTCAGTNLGNLQYHNNIVVKHPHLVSLFRPWSEASDLDKISIGGIDAESKGIELTHFIKYKTPYKIGGDKVDLTIALAKNACCPTILGTPFMQKTQAKIDYGTKTFELNIHSAPFKMEFISPASKL